MFRCIAYFRMIGHFFWINPYLYKVIIFSANTVKFYVMGWKQEKKHGLSSTAISAVVRFYDQVPVIKN